ncbi:MAG: nucleotidyltransferase domain-containing protein [Deltaproteobacteria bacterium]|nr:MAG: nucleotidyltransferase domain-containing protein [Deltaproteobacteria bacterium]
MKDLATAELISQKDRRILIRLKEIVRRAIPTATILLYGSVARGSQDKESDYDVLILTDSPLSTKEEDAVTDAVYDLELEQGIVISTLFYTKGFWGAPLAQVMPFHQRVQEDAVVL